MRISDRSSDVCSSDLQPELGRERRRQVLRRRHAVVRRAAPDLVTGWSPTGANVVVATFSLSPTSQSTRPETAGFFIAALGPEDQTLSPSATSFLLISVKRNGSKEKRFVPTANRAIH